MIRTVMRMGVGCFGVVVLFFLSLFLVVVFSATVINPRTPAPTDFASSVYLQTPPPPLDVPLTLKIVTYNIADAYLFTNNRRERMQAIGALLTELDPDIVGLQESFIASDREVLLEALSRSRLKYHVDFPAATVGNGLLTLSAYPIVESWFHRFQASNPWYKIHQGDWWAGKGVGLARIALPSGTHIDFYNTHAQAGRGDPGNQEVRYLQMGELASFMNQSRSGTGPAFIVGDFNTRLGRPDLERAVDEANLKNMASMDTGIDFIFAVADDQYRMEVLETQVIEGQTLGRTAAIFLSRAPTPTELWRMWFGASEVTPLSDHRGFISTLSIEPIS